MDFTLTVPAPDAFPDARMRKTRAALNATLLSLLEEKALDQITIREIAARADIGYATFFRHYHSKEDLLNDIAAHQIGHLMELALPAFEATDSQAAALALCRFVDENRKLWTALLTGGAAGILREEFVRQASLAGRGRLRRRAWLPVELGAVYGVSATVEILAWWLQHGRNLSVEKIAGILSRLVIAPFVTVNGEEAGATPRAPRKKVRRSR